MQIWKSPYIFMFIWKKYPKNFTFLIIGILKLYTRKVFEMFLPGEGNLSDFDDSNLFLKVKTAFSEYLTSIKTKINMTFVFKEYEIKTKMEQEQWLQLKILFLLGYNLEIVVQCVCVCVCVCVCGGEWGGRDGENWLLVGRGIYWRGEWANFWLVRASRENPA